MLQRRRLKRIRPIASWGRGVTGSTADFGHRRAALVAVRCGFESLRPYSLARSSAVQSGSLISSRPRVQLPPRRLMRDCGR